MTATMVSRMFVQHSEEYNDDRVDLVEDFFNCSKNFRRSPSGSFSSFRSSISVPAVNASSDTLRV